MRWSVATSHLPPTAVQINTIIYVIFLSLLINIQFLMPVITTM
ncbi:MAG: hypothetical protein ABIF11_09700 [Nitrospirota bacterium]